MTEANRKVLAAAVATATAMVLAVAKLVVGLITGSLAVFASAVDSAMDVACSGLNAYFLRIAAHPPDAEHAFGHGKAEALSGVVQAVIVATGGAWLVVRGIVRLLAPQPLVAPETGIAVSVAAFALSLALVVFLRREARATRSIALRADAFHYVTDIATNVVAGLALAGYRLLGWRWLDAAASVAIALYIVWAAVDIVRQAADELLDRGLPREVEDGIKTMIAGLAPEVRGYRGFRSRRAGRTQFFEFDLLVERNTSFERSHELAEAAARLIRERHGRDAQVMVHADPV